MTDLEHDHVIFPPTESDTDVIEMIPMSNVVTLQNSERRDTEFIISDYVAEVQQ